MAGSPVLTLATLDRGIRLLGQPSAYDGLFRRLYASKPITIAVLGASVGQNAGCLTQPGKRCMLYGGERGVGFAVRLLQEINGTWPHQEHRIVNAALDGTGAEHTARCLVSHLPARLDLVLAEWGSMAMHTIWAAHSIERVARTLLARANPPVLLHLSVHEWCSQRISPRAIYRVGDVLKGNLRQYVYPDSPWAAVDDECARVARHYGHSALSVHAMLAPHVIAHSGDDGFALDDITGADCLHPTNGRHGVAYIAQLLSHWLRRCVSCGNTPKRHRGNIFLANGCLQASTSSRTDCLLLFMRSTHDTRTRHAATHSSTSPARVASSS